MKLRYILVLWCLCYIGWAQAEIYKRIDAEGHVTYSSTPLKGAKKLHLEPLSTMPPPPPRARNSEDSSDFPRVDSATQKSRDNSSRQILEDELATEEKALAEARKNLQKGSESPETYTGDDGKVYTNVAKQEEKMNALQKQVQVHEKNIGALKTELSNRNK
ncbi:MAG: DUF4124 domain-containing protein [Gallionellaceae bacterium]|jgi:hypothetical protein